MPDSSSITAAPASKPVNPTNEVRGIPADARRRFELLQECRELVVTRLCKVISESLSKMSSELTELALKTGQRDQQQALLDAVSMVRQNRSEIESRFRKAFVDCFERRLFNKSQTDASADLEHFDGELSLIDDAQIREKLVVDRLVHRSRGKLDPDEVLGIRARLAALLERDWFEETSHPAAPEVVFEALKNALADLAPDGAVQSALLDAFEPHVSAQLNGVYNTVNDRLKANHVLPKIKPRVSVTPSSTRAAKASPAGLSNAAATTASAAHRGAAGDERAAGGYANEGAHAGAVGRGPAYGPELSSIEHTLHQLEQGLPSARLDAARLLTDPATFGVADLPMPSAKAPLISAISSLQNHALGDGNGVDSLAHGAKLSTELMARARQDGSALDQLTVEIVSLVFDYIYADKRLPDGVKQQLLRLQVVAVKAALIDRSFFARRQHPMRRVIDRMTELATDPDNDLAADGPLCTGMAGLVQWILDHFDQDLGTFDAALAQLETLTAEESERRALRLAKLTEQAHREELLASAQEQAVKLIRDRLDPGTPEFVGLFLEQWWSKVCAQASVAQDPETMRSSEAMQTAEAVIWSVASKLPEEVPKLAALLPRIIGQLMKGLKTITIEDAEREQFFNELLRIHTKAIASAKTTEPQKLVAQRLEARLRMKADGSIQFTPVRVADPMPEAKASEGPVHSLRHLEKGDRLELVQDGATVQFKLAWISPSYKLYVLSRFPDDARSLTAQQLASLFETEQARVLDKRSNVDQAIDLIEPRATAQPSSMH